MEDWFEKGTQDWFEKGIQAGKTDCWMDIENTMKKAVQVYEIKDIHKLVWTAISLWEQTEHFDTHYDSKMWRDAKDDIDFYNEFKSEFWHGYLTGRKEVGKDIYRIAKEVLEWER